LYLFNLLPLPFLDGSQLLTTLLEVDVRGLFPTAIARRTPRARTNLALENMERGNPSAQQNVGWRRISYAESLSTLSERRPRSNWVAKMERGIVGGTYALIGADLLLVCLVFLKSA
jgi:hypothetical protein